MRIFTFLFLCFVWGTTWIGIKISLEGIPPFFGAAIRFTLALSLLFMFLKIRKISVKLEKADFWKVFLSAFLMYALDYGLIYWGEQYLSAGVTAIFFATFPIFTGLWATFLFKSEIFYRHKFIGLLLGLAGIIIVFIDQLSLTEFNRGVILGAGAIIIGAAGGAASVVLVKKYLGKINPVSLSFHQMLQGIIFLYFFAFLLEDFHQIQFTTRVVAAVFYLGVVGSALAFALYYWLLQKWSATNLSLIIYITPLVALIIDYLIFDEVIQAEALMGMLVIFAGIALMQMDRSRLRRLSGIIVRIPYKIRRPG
ncbi:MAG: DMT family transporter [Calditrichaeota bacterium]|nr:DMT family transporter [Calditrichota bacterium]RQV99442.1 MAG: DMT family transporter [Calditrichota bacterium]